MNISYHFRSSYLLAFGIEFIVLCVPTFIAIMVFIFNDLVINISLKDQIFFILILCGLSLIIAYGIYNMIQGRNRFEINFAEMNFKVYKNLKLQMDIPLEHVKSVKISHVNLSWIGGPTIKKIEIALKEMEKFQLTIRGKKWILKFIKFIDLLEQYCNEKQIQFIKVDKGK